MVKGFLSQKGIDYTVRNISEDLEARQAVIDMGHRSTPVTLIGEHKVLGFDRGQLEEALTAEGVV
jgi:glutaredoxin